MRPDWQSTWMNVASIIAERSCDPRLKVGAIIVTDDNTQMLAIGYNGDEKGGLNQVESYNPGESGFIHAEINALIKCDYNSYKKKHMYVTFSPCKMCAKAIINAGIEKVFYKESYRDLTGIELLKANNIEVRQVTTKTE